MRVAVGAAGRPQVAEARIRPADPAALCEAAVTAAEAVHRLPPRLLAAISVTETGRLSTAAGRLRPWPWSINAVGEGQFFATSEAAIAAVRALQARGVRSIDVGCMQVNLMYHPDVFASLEAAFEPRGNADYAARLLNSLYAEHRDWRRAVAAYHSETPVLGEAYRALVESRWQPASPPVAAGATAYQDFADSIRRGGNGAYRAFGPASLTYGAFAPR